MCRGNARPRWKGLVVSTLTVVKVGGSLFDVPELGFRLRRWLDGQSLVDVLLVPGGGPTADVIRAVDRLHGMGEEKSHWLALRALALNARILADLLSVARVLESEERQGGIEIIDPFAFCQMDERAHPTEALPHTWAVTSDSVAARVAIRMRATRLILLKSVTIPEGLDWAVASAAGYVDAAFAGVIRGASLTVRAINFRQLES
jgi:5-(aminomethyl)-3-furanmethanol phosphate kinase